MKFKWTREIVFLLLSIVGIILNLYDQALRWSTFYKIFILPCSIHIGLQPSALNKKFTIYMALTHVQCASCFLFRSSSNYLRGFLLLYPFYRNRKRCNLGLKNNKRYAILWKEGILQRLQHKKNGILYWQNFRYAL